MRGNLFVNKEPSAFQNTISEGGLLEQSTGEGVPAGWLGSPARREGSGRGPARLGLGGGGHHVHLRCFHLVGNTALLAANLLFEMLCALPKVMVV